MGAEGAVGILYRRELDGRRVVAAGLLQATSLPFIVAATAIGQDLGLIDAATSAGFIAAGLLSVLIFPLAAVALLNRQPAADELDQPRDSLPDVDEPALG